MKQVATELGFVSAEALRVWLARRRGLVGVRYVRVGRSFERLLLESEIARIVELRETMSRANSPVRQPYANRTH